MLTGWKVSANFSFFKKEKIYKGSYYNILCFLKINSNKPKSVIKYTCTKPMIKVEKSCYPFD